MDPKQEILISPPLDLGEDNRPTLRRRSLIIPLQGLTLLDSVTYVVNVGSAIKDLNEGNPTENLRFVFATGPVLDTATVSGTLVRDYTGEPIEKATFALFSNLADSAVTTGNPTYFAQTDEEGKFTVFNIRPGTYRALALERNPSATNYFIDLKGFSQPLAIGFQDSLYVVREGDNTIGTLQLSAVPRPLRINSIDTTDLGRLKLVLNQSSEGADLRYQGEYLRRNDKDTINLFYRGQPVVDTFVIFQEGAPVDTVSYGATPPATGGPVRVVKSPSGRVNPTVGLAFLLNRPLAAVDTSLISVIQDTVQQPISWSLDSIYPGKLLISAPWESTYKYQLTILPGALSSWAASSNTDTLQRNFTFDTPDKYGLLRLSVNGLDSASQYVLRLVLKDEVLAETQKVINETSSFSVEYPGLSPGTYEVELIVDSNRNGRYDAGNFFEGRQPEKVQRFPVEELRANWEVDEVVDLRQE